MASIKNKFVRQLLFSEERDWAKDAAVLQRKPDVKSWEKEENRTKEEVLLMLYRLHFIIASSLCIVSYL